MTAPVIALIAAAWLAGWIVSAVVETLVKRRMLTVGEVALIGALWPAAVVWVFLCAVYGGVVGLVMAAAEGLSDALHALAKAGR